jgi:tetratricopeptide (TPR) repeat protein
MAAGLLTLYFVMALSASLHKSPAFDEIAHLTGGYNVWLRHDFRFDSGNGDFVKRWAALPLVFSKPAFAPVSDPDWRQGDIFVNSFSFFFNRGNAPDSLLIQGRAMVALLGVLLGLLVFTCARELFGDRGGLLALVLFAFCPHMLAHGALISTDLALSLTLLASTWSIWRLLHEITWSRLLLSLAALALLLLSKMSAVLIVPITGVMLAVRLARGGPLVWRLGPARICRSRARQSAVWAGLIMVHAVFGWAAVWANFNFKYPARADPADPGLGFGVKAQPVNPSGGRSPAAALIASCRHLHLLPEGYFAGPEYLLGVSRTRPSFMNGRWKLGGWHSFFPYAFLVKTPPPLFLLLPLGLAGWWWRRHRAPSPNPSTAAVPSLYAATPILALIAVYGTAAIAQELNIGHRHILPLYPALYILAGSAALWWPARAPWARITVGLLVLWFVLDSLAIRPDYLAYFNGFAGGPAQGHRHLVDSSLDWGMDLPGFKHWLDLHNPDGRDPVCFAYFGTGSPEHYGIRSRRLPGFFDWRAHTAGPLVPGYYAISATLLESIYTRTFGPWNRLYEAEYQTTVARLQSLVRADRDPNRHTLPPSADLINFWETQYDHLRFGRLCAWLRTRRPPDANIGYSILIWKLSQEDLQAALVDPPAECDALPADPDLAGHLGDALFKVGLVSEAIQQYRDILRLNPDLAGVHYRLGIALLQAGLPSEAMGQFAAVLRLQPAFAGAHFQLGNALLTLERPAEAIAHYQAALQLNSGQAEAHNNLGNALLQTGQMAAAISQYEEAVRLNSDYADPHNNLGYALMQMHRRPEARIHFEQALRIDPKNAAARDNLARLLSPPPASSPAN